MSGVGSTNAMKKGSANNPFLAYSKEDMQGYLKSAYTGCIVKYAGSSTMTGVPRGKGLNLGDAQNLVVDLTKSFTDNQGLSKSRKWYITIESETGNKCIMDITINKQTGEIGTPVLISDTIKALIYSIYTPYSSLIGRNINELDVKFLSVTGTDVDRDVVTNWPTTSGWQKDCFNDSGKITLWGYSEKVTAIQNQNDMDYWSAYPILYTEPYVANVLYKVVYGNGQYYFEEYYHISDNVTTATVEDVALGKTFYDFTGTKQTGTGTKINPYLATDLDTFKSFPVGSFIKWLGPDRTVLDETTGQTLIQNEIYRAVEEGDILQYAILPTLSNPGTAADLAQGKQLIDGEGKVVEGEAVKGLNLIKYANGTLTEFDTDAELTIGENCDITLSGQKLLSYVNIPNAKVISMMAFAECENLTKLNQNICANINAFYSWFYGSTKKIYPDSLVTRLSSVNTKCFISVNNNPYAIYIGGYWYINSVSSYITNNVEVLYPLFVSGSKLNTIYTFNNLKCIPTGAFYSVKLWTSGISSMTINAPELEAIYQSAIHFDTGSSSYLPSLLILNASKIKYYGYSAISYVKVAGVQNYNLGEYYGYGHFRLYSTDGSTSLYYNDYPNAKEWYGGNFDRTKMLNLPKATAVSIDGGIGASIPLAKTVSWYNMPTGVELPECEKLDVTYMSSNGVIIGPKVKIFDLYGSGCTEIHLPNFEGDMYLYTDLSAWRSSVARIQCGTLEIIDCPRCSKYVNIYGGNLKSIKLSDNIYSLWLQGNIASNCSINLLNSSQYCSVSASYSGGYLDITLSAASSAYISGTGIGTVTIIDNGSGNIYGCKSINISSNISNITYSLSYNSWLENISMPMLERVTLYSCPKLTDLYMPNASSTISYFLNVSKCTSLSAIILTKYISSFYSTYLYSTPMSVSSYLGYFGSIYVPASYVQSYKRASGWSYYSSRITSITDLPQELKDKYGLNGVE